MPASLRFSLVLLTSVVSSAATGADWPAFRGPQGNGVTPDKAPTKWSATENVRWKVELGGTGNGSPIVAHGRVFVTYAADKGQQRTLAAFDRKTGTNVWARSVQFGKVLPTHETNPYAGTTPVATSDRVVVWHGSAGLFCYDLDGKELWKRELGEFKHMWGYGSSPVVHGDRIILHSGPGKREFVGAYKLSNGETLWETDEPTDGDGETRGDKKYMGSWATPVLATVNGKTFAVCSLPTRVAGYDVETGTIAWFCNGIRGPKGDLAYSSAIIADGLCIATGGFGGPSLAFKLGGSGDLTESARLWRNEVNPQSIGTGIAKGKFLFRPNAGPGTIQCLNIETGKEVWGQRASEQWASLVEAGGLLYATTQNGTTLVFEPNTEKFVSVSENKLGDPTNSTPAVSDGQLFLRTAGSLYCIAE